MVLLLVLSRGGSVLDWLVVRFRGDSDGVRGQQGTRFESPSMESSPLPLHLEGGASVSRSYTHADVQQHRYSVHQRTEWGVLAIRDAFLVHIWRPAATLQAFPLGQCMCRFSWKENVSIPIKIVNLHTHCCSVERKEETFSLECLHVDSHSQNISCWCDWGRGRENLPILPRKTHRCPEHSVTSSRVATIHMSKAVIIWLISPFPNRNRPPEKNIHLNLSLILTKQEFLVKVPVEYNCDCRTETAFLCWSNGQ